MKSTPLDNVSFAMQKRDAIEEKEILLDAFVEKFKNNPTSSNFKKLQRKMFDYQQVTQAKGTRDLKEAKLDADAEVFLNL